jgi:hypothetical protein
MKFIFRDENVEFTVFKTGSVIRLPWDVERRGE